MGEGIAFVEMTREEKRKVRRGQEYREVELLRN